MKLLALFSAAGALLLLPQAILAAPVLDSRETTASTASTTASDAAAVDGASTDASSGTSSGTSSGKSSPASVAVAANYGSPRCKSAALLDLCTSANANAYCDATGFHCNFMASCKGVCWCE